MTEQVPQERRPRERAELTFTLAGPVTFTPPTPEQRAAYEEEVRDLHGGTYYPRELQARGELSPDEADEAVRRARLDRRLKKSRRRRGGG